MLIYLATPYSHPKPEVRKARFDVVNQVAARLMEQGHAVFSPISHSHPVEQYMAADKQSWEFWKNQDLPILRVCKAIYVLQIPGWDVSVGVAGEIEEGRNLGLPVTMIDPYEYCHPVQLARLCQ